MKMLNAGTAQISQWDQYSRNCNLGQCRHKYIAPVPSLGDVQLFVNFGASKPTAFEFTIVDVCMPRNSAVAVSGCYIIAYSGAYWYGVFKNFTSTGIYSTFLIALQTDAQTYFSEQYQLPSSCDTLTKINVCYPYNYNAEDTNGIYVGQPDPNQTVQGNADVFYHHTFWTRQGEVIETQNKVTYTSNKYKNFASILQKTFEFRPELVPGWYKDYLLSVYFRGDILINGNHTLVTDVNFEDVDVDFWKAYAVLGVQVKGGFGCTPIDCPTDCGPTPCVPVSFTLSGFGNAGVGRLYSKTIPITGDYPYTLSGVSKPDWLTTFEIDGTNLVMQGTPSEGDVGTQVISFTISNACGNQPYTDGIDVVEGVGFNNPTFVSGDDLNHEEIANIYNGVPGSTITVTLDTLTNSNGGQLKVNGLQAFQGYTWHFVLDSAGEAHFTVDINGVIGTGTAILGHFTITGTSSGVINPTLNTYQASKTF